MQKSYHHTSNLSLICLKIIWIFKIIFWYQFPWVLQLLISFVCFLWSPLVTVAAAFHLKRMCLDDQCPVKRCLLYLLKVTRTAEVVKSKAGGRSVFLLFLLYIVKYVSKFVNVSAGLLEFLAPSCSSICSLEAHFVHEEELFVSLKVCSSFSSGQVVLGQTICRGVCGWMWLAVQKSFDGSTRLEKCFTFSP